MVDAPFSVLGVRYNMGIGLLDSFNGMNLCDDDVGQGSLVLYVDEDENIRATETGMGLFDSGNLFECLDDVLGLAGFDLNQDVRACCHDCLLDVLH